MVNCGADCGAGLGSSHFVSSSLFDNFSSNVGVVKGFAIGLGVDLGFGLAVVFLVGSLTTGLATAGCRGFIAGMLTSWTVCMVLLLYLYLAGNKNGKITRQTNKTTWIIVEIFTLRERVLSFMKKLGSENRRSK